MKDELDRPRGVNVGDAERIASVACGAALVVYGLKNRSALGRGLAARGGALAYRGSTGLCPAYEAAGIDTAGTTEGIHIERAVTIDRPASELYRFWRDFSNLPRFMESVESVTTQ